MAKTVEELQSGYDNLVQQREKLLLEIARVSEDLAKARERCQTELSERLAQESCQGPAVFRLNQRQKYGHKALPLGLGEDEAEQEGKLAKPHSHR